MKLSATNNKLHNVVLADARYAKNRNKSFSQMLSSVDIKKETHPHMHKGIREMLRMVTFPWQLKNLLSFSFDLCKVHIV